MNKNKIIIAVALIAAGAVTWRHGMAMEQQGAPAGAGQVRIFKTKNNESVEVPEDRLILFGTINDLLIDAPERSDIPVGRFSSAALKKIVGDLDWVLHDVMPNMNENVGERDAARTVVRAMPQVQYSNSTELYLTIEALNAADFLNQPSLVERYTREVADMAMSGGAMQLLARGNNQYGAMLSRLHDNMQNAILYYMPNFWTLQHNSAISSVAISADGKTVVTGSSDKTAKIVKWNGNTWAKQHTIEHNSRINSIAISPDGNTVATGSSDNSAKIVAWDGNTWTEHVIHHDARVNSVAISADGKTVVIGTFDSVVMIVTRKDNTWTEPQTIHDTHEEEEDDDEDDDDEDDDDDVAIDSIELVAISADGNTVVTGSDWDTTKILAWDGRQWAEHVIYDGGENANASVAISADGNTVVTGSWDTTVKIVTRNADTWTEQYIRSYFLSVLSVAISADGNTVAIGLLDGSAKILTRKDNTWTEQGTINHNNEVDSIAISADGNTVVIGSKTANIVKWDGIMWRPQHVIHHDGSITSVAISADGALVVTGSEDKTAEISLCLPHSLPGISDFNTRLFEHLLWWAKGSEQKIAKTGWAKNTLDHIRWHAVNFVDKKILQTWIRETMEKVSNRNNQGAPQVSGRKHALGQAGEGSTKRTKQSED